MFAFFYDLPSFFATCHTKVARISYGKFDHLPSPIELVCAKRPNYHSVSKCRAEKVTGKGDGGIYRFNRIIPLSLFGDRKRSRRRKLARRWSAVCRLGGQARRRM